MVIMKRDCVIRSLLHAGLLFCFVEEIISAITEGSFHPHCIQMSRSKRGKDVHNIIAIEMNDSEFPEPPSKAKFISLEICPNNTKLKVSWKMKRNSGKDLKLCYIMRSTFNGRDLVAKCVKLKVQYNTGRSNMICWFPMSYLSDRPIISASASHLDSGRTQPFYFGQLNTNLLDDTDSCKHVCDAPMIHIRNVILCNYKSYVEFDTRVSVKGLHLYPIDSATCQERSVSISGQVSNRLEFELNCRFTGVVNITILYTIKGVYCHKYYPVKMICNSVSTTTSFSIDEIRDSSTYLVTTVGIITFTLLIIATIIVFCVIQRSKTRRVRHNSEDTQMVRSDPENIPLNCNTSNTTRDRDNADANSKLCIVEMTTKV